MTELLLFNNHDPTLTTTKLPHSSLFRRCTTSESIISLTKHFISWITYSPLHFTLLLFQYFGSTPIVYCFLTVRHLNFMIALSISYIVLYDYIMLLPLLSMLSMLLTYQITYELLSKVVLICTILNLFSFCFIFE